MALPDQRLNEAHAPPLPVAMLAAAVMSLLVAVYSLWVGEYGLSGLGLAAVIACGLALRSHMRKPVKTLSQQPAELGAEMHRQFEYLQSEIADLAHISNDAATRVTQSFYRLQQYMQALTQLVDDREQKKVPALADNVDRQYLQNSINKEVNRIIQTMQYDDIVQQIGTRLGHRLSSFESIISEVLEQCLSDQSASIDTKALQQLRQLDQHDGLRVHDLSRAYHRQQSNDDGVELF